MTDTGLFSVGEFAKLSRTTPATLYHYEKIGLISPILRGDNHYRYYSSGQLAALNVIRSLQELGMSLTDIKVISDQRSPEFTEKILKRQIKKINREIDGWVRARKLLFTIQQSIESVLEIDEETVTIQFMPAEAIILGEINDYSSGRNDYDALLSFYHSMRDKSRNKYPELDLNYPVWGLFSEDQMRRGEFAWPERYYFYNPEGHDKRPAALYAIGYTRGGYGQSEELYAHMMDYIEQNGFEICGNAYEEYPLNEVCVSDEANYLIRVMITVREKDARAPRGRTGKS